MVSLVWFASSCCEAMQTPWLFVGRGVAVPRGPGGRPPPRGPLRPLPRVHRLRAELRLLHPPRGPHPPPPPPQLSVPRVRMPGPFAPARGVWPPARGALPDGALFGIRSARDGACGHVLVSCHRVPGSLVCFFSLTMPSISVVVGSVGQLDIRAQLKSIGECAGFLIALSLRRKMMVNENIEKNIFNFYFFVCYHPTSGWRSSNCPPKLTEL